MKTIALSALVAMSFGTLACGNPCEKLAKAVCDKVKDPKICDAQKARAKAATSDADKEKCKARLQNVDKFVEGLQKFQQMKDMFKDFGDGALKKAGGMLKNMGPGAVPAPAPAPGAAPAPAPAPAAPVPAPAPAK